MHRDGIFNLHFLLAFVVTMVNVRITVLSPPRHPSHNPANTMGWPSAREMALRIRGNPA